MNGRKIIILLLLAISIVLAYGCDRQEYRYKVVDLYCVPEHHMFVPRTVMIGKNMMVVNDMIYVPANYFARVQGNDFVTEVLITESQYEGWRVGDTVVVWR